MANKILENITSVYTDKSINGWIRGAIWAGTIVVVYIGGKAIYRKIFPTDEQKKSKENLKAVEAELNSAISKQPLTYSIVQYNQWADSIANSFKGCDYTSVLGYSFSYSTINAIFEKLKNDSDYLQLVKSYGIRDIDKSWACGGDYIQLDLPNAIGKQLTYGEIEKGLGVLPSLNRTLEKQGIKYRLTNI